MNLNSGGHRSQLQEKKKSQKKALQEALPIILSTRRKLGIPLAQGGGNPLLPKGKSGFMPTAPIATAMSAQSGLMPILTETDKD